MKSSCPDNHFITASAVTDQDLGTATEEEKEITMEYMDDVSGEYQRIQDVREAVGKLVDDGQVEMMGRVANGEPAYTLTASIGLAHHIWNSIRPYLGILPAFVAEQVAALTAVILAGFCEPLAHYLAELAEPLPSLAERLMDFAHRLMHTTDRIADIVDRLHLWRLHATPHREHIWLSIRY